MKRLLNDLTNVLHRPVESAANSGLSLFFTLPPNTAMLLKP